MRELNSQWRGRVVNVCDWISLVQMWSDGMALKAWTGWRGSGWEE